MYSIDYQVTHDIDYFFVMQTMERTRPIHIASNGGVMPDKLGSMAFIQKTQNEAFVLPFQFSYELNMDYLNQLNVEDFPLEEDVAESGFLQTEHYTQFNDRIDLPFHLKVYAYSFVEMARRGFWSFDRLTEYSTQDMYNARKLSNIYQLVAYPKVSEGISAQLPSVGHVFQSDSLKFLQGKEKWNLTEWLSSSKRIDIVQTERGHYTSPRRLPKIYR